MASKIDITIYDDDEVAASKSIQAKYLVHGLDDVYWLDEWSEVMLILSSDQKKSAVVQHTPEPSGGFRITVDVWGKGGQAPFCVTGPRDTYWCNTALEAVTCVAQELVAEVKNGPTRS